MKTLAFLLIGTAFAAQAPSQSQCQAMWQQASNGQQTLTQSQSAKYINSSNFKQVDTNNDGQISQSEFLAACNNGLVESPSP